MEAADELQHLPLEYPLDYQEEAIQEYYDYILQNFRISFKSNVKGLRNPTQVIADDTLYCIPKKPLCVYLGEKVFPLGESPPPQIVVYLKFADDAKKNVVVSRCEKHKNQGRHVIYSDNSGVVEEYDEARAAFALRFPYPFDDDVPSISLGFHCSSSCFGRCAFELIVDFDFNDSIVVHQKHLIKVSTNPGRDSGLFSYANDFIRNKGTFSLSKPRKRHSVSESQTTAKRSLSDGQSHGQEVPEEPVNHVYNLPVYGIEAFKTLLKQSNMMNKCNKYYAMKGPPAARGLLNSQIPAGDPLVDWLSKIRMNKHKSILNDNNIYTMFELHKVYNSHLFEDMDIPHEDSCILHRSFIYWQTSFLHDAYENGNNDTAENDNV
uniref:P53 DNA-binding domain-containing protein n=1 Tax=Panagrolaimus superbus TaxID=310955 RepID=A0A914XZR1_9BILA